LTSFIALTCKSIKKEDSTLNIKHYLKESMMKLKMTKTLYTSTLILSLLSQSGCGGGSSGSDGEKLEGLYTGTAFDDVVIEFNWQQSGTEVTGTVVFDNTVYQYEGVLSGNQLSGTALNNTNQNYCKNLSMQNSEVTSDRNAVSGRIVVRDRNCDGTGVITGGTGNYAVSKR
jgi:hypothetical protein